MIIPPDNHRQLVKPPHRVNLLIDTTITADLSTPRSLGGNWINLLSRLSRLSSVGSIIMSVVGADWEMRGGFTRFEGGRPIFYRLDPTFEPGQGTNKSLSVPIFEEFISRATQLRIINDRGEYTTIKGQDEKVMVVDDRYQHQKAFELSEIYFEVADLEERKRQNKIQQANHAGDRALVYLAKRMPFKGPCFIVSNDKKSFAKMEDFCTAAGKPVGRIDLYNFMEAAFKALHSKDSFGLFYKDIATTRPGADLSHFHVEESYMSTGVYKDGSKGASLKQLLLFGERRNFLEPSEVETSLPQRRIRDAAALPVVNLPKAGKAQ